MDIKKIREKTNDLFGKYKYVGLVVIIGIALMLIPGKTDATQAPEPTTILPPTEDNVKNELEAVLCHVAGAGQVKVMLTLATGQRTVYQTDQNISVSEGSNNTQNDTVTVTDADRQQIGLIQQINPPTYLGAIVVCEGADSPTVRLAIVEAVSKVTGLGADRISVLKMK